MQIMQIVQILLILGLLEKLENWGRFKYMYIEANPLCVLGVQHVDILQCNVLISSRAELTTFSHI